MKLNFQSPNVAAQFPKYHGVFTGQDTSFIEDSISRVRDWESESQAKASEGRQDAYNQRLRNAHTVREEKLGQSGVNAWNVVEDASQIDPEVLEVLNTWSETSSAEKSGYELPMEDGLDSAEGWTEQSMHNCNGGAWVKSEHQPEVIDEYVEWGESDYLVTVYAPQEPASYWDAEKFHKSETRKLKKRRNWCLDNATDKAGRERNRAKVVRETLDSLPELHRQVIGQWIDEHLPESDIMDDLSFC